MGVLPKAASVVYDIDEDDDILEREGFCEYAYDFHANELLTLDGKHYYVYGNEAMKIWIYKCMITDRYRYSAYSDRFGSEVFTLVGEVISDRMKVEEIKRYITEAVMVHPFMRSINHIEVERLRDGANVTVYYTTFFNDKVVKVSCIVTIE